MSPDSNPLLRCSQRVGARFALRTLTLAEILAVFNDPQAPEGQFLEFFKIRSCLCSIYNERKQRSKVRTIIRPTRAVKASSAITGPEGWTMRFIFRGYGLERGLYVQTSR